MAEVAAITQGVQLGVETTPGTAVAANKKFPSITLEPSIKANVNTYRASGSKVDTLAAIGKEWSEWKLGGAPTYDELTYLLASILAATTPGASTDTSDKPWTFTPAAYSPDTVKTFTIEAGDSVRARKAAFGIMQELSLDWTSDELSLGGSMLAKAITDNITLTASPTTLAQIPILAKDVKVYADSTGAGIGTTELTRVLKWGLKIGNRQTPFFPAGSGGTFGGVVEDAVNGELEITAMADAAGMAYLSRLRDSARLFHRFKFTSALLAGAATVPYSLTLDVAGAVKDAKDFEVEQGLYCCSWTLALQHDATWGKWIEAKLVNKLASL